MTTSARRAAFPRMIEQFLRQRGASVLPLRELERLGSYLRGLIKEAILPPRAGGRPDWNEIAARSGVDADALIAAGSALEPGIDAVTRYVGPKARKRKLTPSPDDGEAHSARPDGIAIQQIVPGLNCFRPSGERGACCSPAEEPNISNCDLDCMWNGLLPEFKREVLRNIEGSLDHLRAQPNSQLVRSHHVPLILEWLRRFPDLSQAFPGDELFNSIVK